MEGEGFVPRKKNGFHIIEPEDLEVIADIAKKFCRENETAKFQQEFKAGILYIIENLGMFIDPKCSEAINNMLSAIFDDHEFRQNISEILHATTKNSSK